MIAGGWSSEREVSLNGAKSIEKALLQKGHEVTFFDLLLRFDELLAVARLHDFAFLNLHGEPGEDGLVQAMLDQAGCPYQGSRPAGSFLALHKAAAKQLFRENGLATPPWEFLPQIPPAGWQPALPYPLFVKSNTGGSSLRLGQAANRQELDNFLQEIFAAGEEALLEKTIRGKDLTCGILGREALPPVLIEPIQGAFFDYKSKYAKGGAKETCPAPIDADLTTKLQKMALTAHCALGLSGCSRSDFVVDANNEPYILETNTLPGMTATSLVPQEAASIGLDFGNLLERLIKLGLEECPKKRN